MKYFSIPILLLILTALTFYSPNPDSSNLPIDNKRVKKDISLSRSKVIKGNASAIYNSTLSFFPKKNIVFIKNKIIWKNASKYPVVNLYFNLSRRLDNDIQPDSANNNIKINAVKFSCSKPYLKLGIDEQITSATNNLWERIDFKKPILPGDSVIFFIEYNLPVFSSFMSSNFIESGQLFIDNQWYPRIPVFEQGKWQIFKSSKFTREFKSFADFNLGITFPKNFYLITSGNAKAKRISKNRQYLKIIQKNVSDFVIILKNNSDILNYKYQIKNNIKLNLFIAEKFDNYVERIKQAAEHSFAYLKENIGSFPFDNFSIVFLPGSLRWNKSSYSNIILLSKDVLFSGNSNNLEKVIANKIAEQYFHFIAENNSQSEAWISRGISKYVSGRILNKYYKTSQAIFKFLKYVSVKGLQFLSYKGIPIIYTLGDYNVPQEALSLNKYYSGYLTGSISDSSYLFTDIKSYNINSVEKPFLMLLSLERNVGRLQMNNILRKYFQNYKFKYVSKKNFFDIISKNSDNLILKYINQIYNGFDYYDMKINYLTGNDRSEYKLGLVIKGHCKFVADVFVYTKSDTLKFKWNTANKWEMIKFKTNKTVLAAEIDPEHKFIFDSNYSNNSYTINRMTWASISISTRWFFWIQNALMILGSVA